VGLVNVTPWDGEKLVGNVGGDLRKIGPAFSGIASLIGLISVANTLSTSVPQRRGELGLRSALGWPRRRVARLILLEAMVGGLVAGILGSAVGFMVAMLWCTVSDWPFILPAGLGLMAVGLAVFACMVGHLLPARRATSISPMEAMRS
jgi:putative ABC transport system permease protein